MISSTLGAPLGGTMRADQYGFDVRASLVILPLKGWGGAGICAPSIVTCASGDPGAPPTTFCAAAGAAEKPHSNASVHASAVVRVVVTVRVMMFPREENEAGV